MPYLINKRKLLLRLVLAFFLTSLVGGLFIYVLWQKGVIQTTLHHWLEKRVVRSCISKIESSLPFVIEDYDVIADWKSFKTGRISKLYIKLRSGDLRLFATGPLKLENNPESGTYRATYDPVIRLEPTQTPDKNLNSSNLKLKIWVEIREDLSKLEAIGIESEKSNFGFPYYGLDLKDLMLTGSWSPLTEEAKIEITSDAGNYQSSNGQQALSFTSPSLAANVELNLDPFRLGPQGTVEIRTKNAEVLWNDLYLALPLKTLPLNLSFTLNTLPGESTPNGSTFAINLGSKKTGLRMSGNVSKNADILLGTINWKTSPIPLNSAVEFLGTIPQLALLNEVKIKKGSLSSTGTFSTDFSLKKPFDIAKSKLAVDFLMSDLTASWSELGVNNGEFMLSAPLSTISSLGFKSYVTASGGYYKKFIGELEKSSISGTIADFKTLTLQTDEELKLKVRDIPVQLGKLKATFDGEKSLITSSIKLSPTPVSQFLSKMCIDADNIPPATVSINFSKIEATPELIEPTGTVEVALFDGTVKLDEIGFFDLLSQVPEIDFNAKWEKIRLDKLGEWLNFGEMDGFFTGHAKDVTFQSWLPTHYDLRVEIKPDRKSDVVFSPEAMKNFIRLFAGEDIDNLPGIADWIAFGMPSRMFGGYDIDCAGISVFSEEGTIMLETVCPAENKEYFILKGRRFKMPLKSTRHPLIVDATAMGNFVRHMVKQLNSLNQTETENNNKEKQDDSIQKKCLPDTARL